MKKDAASKIFCNYKYREESVSFLSLGHRLYKKSFLSEILQTYQEHEVKLEE